MSGNHPREDLHAFVVRIWYEAEEGSDAEVPWRGSVSHVGSGNRLYFYDLSAFVQFIREQARIKAGQEPSEGAGQVD